MQGTGTSEGVSYTYRLSTAKWFCNYECSIHRLLLDKETEQFMTDEFEAVGYSWKLKITNINGQLGAYLVSTNDISLDVFRTCSLIHSQSESKSITKRGRGLFAPNESRGFVPLVPTDLVRDEEKQFLYGDSFKIGLSFRLMTAENELSSIIALPNSATVTWSLKDLNEIDPGFDISSSEFSVGSHKWKLALYPKGKPSGPEEILVRLHLKDNPPIRVNMTFIVLNFNSGREVLVKSRDHVYNRVEGTGFNHFLPSNVLENEEEGFVNGGWFTITCQFTLLEEDGQPLKTSASICSRASGGSQLGHKDPPHDVKDAQDDEGTPKCAVCKLNPPTAGILHHKKVEKCLCHSCAVKMEEKAEAKSKTLCPVCKEPVEMVILDIVG